MTKQHTPGMLTVRGGYSIYANDGKTPVADTCLTNSVPANDEANARRLVAAWNYVEMLGMSTEEIELSEQPIYSRRKLEKQNAELLEALKRIEGASMSMYATRSDMLEYCQDIARAAIAKVSK